MALFGHNGKQSFGISKDEKVSLKGSRRGSTKKENEGKTKIDTMQTNLKSLQDKIKDL